MGWRCSKNTLHSSVRQLNMHILKQSNSNSSVRSMYEAFSSFFYMNLGVRASLHTSIISGGSILPTTYGGLNKNKSKVVYELTSKEL